MQVTKVLPPNYQHQKTLDLSSSRVVLWLNLIAIPLLFFYGWFFNAVIFSLRPFSPFRIGVFKILTSFSGWGLIALLFSVIIMLVFHELVHGLFFWLFTRERPKFALRAGYAYAAAPDWFLPGVQYIIVGLSPFFVISILCIFLGILVTPSVVPYLLLIATFNAAGALGDMIVVAWVFRQPKTILVKDEGDKFSSFAPDSE
jgi:hypothetical protein